MDATVTRQELLDRLKASVGANYMAILSLIFPGLRPWHWLFGTGAMIQLVVGLALLERIRGQVMRGLALNDGRS